MSDGADANPMLSELLQRVRDAQVFLRMAAIELRRIADGVPDMGDELRHVAQQLAAEAEELIGGDPGAAADPEAPAPA